MRLLSVLLFFCASLIGEPVFLGLLPGDLPSGDAFNIDVKYAPKSVKPGYVFKVTLTPKSDIQFKRIGQNYTFLIDCSNPISRPRYLQNTKAVSTALAFLQPGDTFNIVMFGGRIVRLSSHNLEWNSENIKKAREFIAENCEGFFTASELYSSLSAMIPTAIDETRINTAILLSDGDTHLSLEKQRQTIGNWTLKNNGKTALFCIVSDIGKRLPLLELLSSFNKGALVYVPKHHEVKDDLVELVRNIANPVGTDLTITAITDDKMQIVLQPKDNRLPHLYQNRPLVLYGSTNRLTNFTLHIEGKIYGHPFVMEKEIPLKSATIGSYSIERNWMQLAVQEIYENYFEDGNVKHLEVAKQLLAPLNLPVPLCER